MFWDLKKSLKYDGCICATLSGRILTGRLHQAAESKNGAICCPVGDLELVKVKDPCPTVRVVCAFKFGKDVNGMCQKRDEEYSEPSLIHPNNFYVNLEI